MNVSFASTADGRLLHSVRRALSNAERVLMCVAFVREAGLHLLEEELKELRRRERPVSLLVTTTLGSTTPQALDYAATLGVDVRVYNHAKGTYHPKIFLGIGKRECRAFIGSANLTRGLVTNVEAGLLLEGSLRDAPINDALTWAEQLWDDHPVVEFWDPDREVEGAVEETIDADLLAALKVEVARDPTFFTLAAKRPNKVLLTPKAAYVETERSKGAPQEIPAWMFNLAWGWLKTHGTLSNKTLLNELHVHRSSAVCAMLGRVPGVKVTRAPDITLELTKSYPPTNEP